MLNRINRALAKILPFPLSHHCCAAKYEHGELTLIADSSAWASRARFYSKQLSQKLNIKTVTIKVQQKQHLPPQPPKRQAKMTQEASNLLTQLAESTSDSKLKEAIQRLSQHVNEQD